MEKLLQLLNEYSSGYLWGKEYYIEDWTVYLRERDDDYDQFNYDDFTVNVISKNFWFIKWLVENDKIDVQWTKNILYESEIFNPLPYTNLVERLIMYLSIVDDPIEFLISILK